MFRATKDTNTGVVYDWYRKNEDGTETHVNVPEHKWKREQDWTQSEIAAMFDESIDSLITAETVSVEADNSNFL